MSDQRQSDRREQQDRRQVVDRRKQSDNRRAVFEVCRSTLHLALVSLGDDTQPDRLLTRSIRWRNESTSLHTEEGARELTAAFRTLVTEERLVGATVRIALNGEFCVTRVVTGAAEHVRHEMDELEERSAHYLLLGPGEKALAGSVQQLDARHQHAMLTVANQKTVSLMVDIAAEVGIKIEVIEPSLVGLSRAQARLTDGCQDACLIVQLDESGAELGICYEGRLLLEYRPGGQASAENIAELTSQHLKRLQRHLGRHHSYLKTSLSHVYLAGEPEMVDLALRRFASHKEFDAHVFDPSQLDAEWKHAADSPGPEYAAALGAALSFYAADTEHATPNLIERLLASTRMPLKPFLLRSVIPMAAVVLLAMTLLILWARERVATSALHAELDRLEPATTRSTELRLTLIRAEAKLTQLQELKQRLPKRELKSLLTHIAQSMPDDVWLDRFTYRDGRTASLAGASYTDSGVYDFVSYLKQVPEISQIDLEGTGVGQTPTGPATSFDLELSLAQSDDQKNREGRND